MPAGAGAGKTNRLNGRMFDQGRSDFETSIKEHGEDAVGERVLAHGSAHSATDQLRSPGVGGVGLHYYGIAGGQGGGGVAAGNGKSNGKIAGGKDGDRPQRTQHGTNIGSRQRLAVGQ